jgi:4-amino-4-deoxy-L-arabinose transferase-like glycosyltransferase
MGAVALLIYVLTISPGVAWDDSGELAAGVTRLGIVHRTGYPLYIILGKAFTAIDPFGSAGARVSLWSAFAAAAAVGLVAWYVRAVSGSLLGAGVAAIVLATGPLFWYQAATASVYPLFVLSLTALVASAHAWRRTSRARYLAIVGASAAAVFLSHNTGLVFVAGAAVFLAANRGQFRRPTDLLPLAAALIPLATVAYLPLREGYHGFPNLLADQHASVVGWLLGSGPDSPALFGASKHGVAVHVWRLVLLVAASLGPAALALAPIGAFWLRRTSEYLWCCLLPALIVAAVVVTTAQGFPYWQFPLLLAGAIATGVALPRVAVALRRRAPLGTVALVALVASFALVPALGSAFLARGDRNALPWARAALSSLPAGAQVVAPWRVYAPLRGLQELGRLRPDVSVVEGPQTWQPATLAGLRGRYVVVLGGSPPAPPPGLILQQIGRPTRVNFKGLTGLGIGPFRIGIDDEQAYLYKVL